MEFCDVCGTYLRKKREGLWCSKCNTTVRSRRIIKPKRVEKKDPAAVHVVAKSEDEYLKVSQTCSICGGGEAYHWFSQVAGEHAGIRRERTVEHFKCTKCSHSWTETS